MERAGALPGEVYPQIACRPIVMQISMTDPFPLAEIDVWKEVLARPRDERIDLYADAAWRDRARDVTLEAWSHRWSKTSCEETGAHADAIGIPLDQLAAERGTTPFDLMLDLALADDMATRYPDRAWRTTTTTRSATCWPTSAPCSACPTPAPTPASSATPATRPTCSATGCATAGRSRWRTRCGGSPAIPHQVFRIARARAGAGGLLRRPGGLRSRRRSAARRSSGVHDLPGGADRLVVRSTGVEHVWVNGVATRHAGEDIPGAARPASCAASRPIETLTCKYRE